MVVDDTGLGGAPPKLEPLGTSEVIAFNLWAG